MANLNPVRALPKRPCERIIVEARRGNMSFTQAFTPFEVRKGAVKCWLAGTPNGLNMVGWKTLPAFEEKNQRNK